MAEKSFVTLEQVVCVVCGKQYDSGALLLDKRLRERFDHKTVTGFGDPCKECEEMLHKDGERIALVGCDDKLSKKQPNGNVKPEDAHRTGDIIWIRREAFARMFNASCPDLPMVFVDQEVVKMLKAAEENRVAEARAEVETLNAHADNLKAEEKPAVSGAVTCPKCGARNWTYVMRHPSDPAHDKFKCRDCKHQWKRYD